MKALVLARGLGTRMRAAGSDGAVLSGAQAAAADGGHKAMMPFGRPFLDHVLHALADAGIRDAALVLGPEHEAVRAYYRALETTRIAIAFVTQREPLGTADAVASAEPWAGSAPFLVLNGDNLYPAAALAAMIAARGPALAGFASDTLGLPADRIGAFALVERDASGCMSRIVEKPGAAAVEAAGPEALVSMNLWRFDTRIFDACRDVPLSARGEKELPHAASMMAARGACIEVVAVRGDVADLSSRADVATVARRLEHAPVNL